MTKKKMGRPKNKDGTMEARITVVVSEAQAKIIKGVAEAKGKSASAYARDVLLASLPPEIE